MASVTTVILTALAFLNQMTEAHNMEAYQARTAVQADFAIAFPGAFELAGTMTFDTPVGKARLDLDDGTAVVFDGQNAWVTPAEKADPRMRFHVLTWPYFLAAPFKMGDPGVNLAEPTAMPINGPEDQHQAVKVTFDDGTGDAPDDWYYLFTDDQNRLSAMAYIVTFGKSAPEAEKKPSMIVYDGFETVEDVVFATQWSFHYWNPKAGIEPGEPKGTARITNIRFVEIDDSTFAKPEGAAEAPLPEG